MRLVVVDHHEVVVSGLKLLLSGAGIEVAATVSDAAQALKAIEQTACDLVLLDLDLPPAGLGLGCVREITGRKPPVPVLVLTEKGGESLVLQALEAGASGYVVKHCAPDHLLTGIRAVAGGGTYFCPHVSGRLLPRLRQLAARNGDLPSISPRQKELLGCLAEGLSNAQAASRLHISLGSVKNLLRELFSRFGVADRTLLVLKAIEAGAIPRPD
ncbi:MAG TPA: response regulator transcription factor [Candidatus Nitrosotenuis sp.]|jgi:DNA-binding NarL/FixJ family response regulator|nr:response regulator transcription factor [Candidatus Nitrosotenuis sp.]